MSWVSCPRQFLPRFVSWHGDEPTRHESIISVARQTQAERLIISDTDLDPDVLAELLRACKREGLKASLLPHVFDVLGPSVELDDVEGVTVIGIKPPVLSRSSRFLKRGLDFCGSGVLLLVPR